ncbi:CAP domain-containing protein [Enterococcus sp. AZ103]|uniref:CAP domain-containing protein n=1 Tax=Enterococcus sp. AZ103 TaxID=2774628 RepID=UPI003F21CEAB
MLKNKKLIGQSAFLLGAIALGMTLHSTESDAAQTMFRVYNPNSGEHFYTDNLSERNMLVKEGWKSEGVGWYAPDRGDVVYRVYNPNAGDHHYTLDANEKNYLVSKGWRDEGIGWYSDFNKSVQVYRSYNPNAWSGTHNYTTSLAEKQNLERVGWRGEGVGWYGVPKDDTSIDDNEGSGISDIGLQTEISKLVFQKINAYRAELGKQQLQTSSLLQGCGNIRANDLTERYDHVRPDGMRVNTFVNESMDYKSSGAFTGENIFTFPYEVRTATPDEYATKVFEGWKSSDGHNKNMINGNANDGTIGVKVLKDGTNYWNTYVVLITGYNKDYVSETPEVTE